MTSRHEGEVVTARDSCTPSNGLALGLVAEWRCVPLTVASDCNKVRKNLARIL
jgi:hypothetical protein